MSGCWRAAGWAQDLPTVAISAAADEVAEGTSATFTLTRSGVTEGAVAVTVAVSATGGLLLADTPPFSTEVVFVDGETTRTLVLATVADRVEEADSVVTARLAPDPNNPVFAVESSQDAATVTVTDNDAAQLTLVVDPSTVLEGGVVRVTVALVGEETFATDQTITLAFPTDSTDTARATKEDDYTVGSETLTLAAGARAVSTLVTTVDDAVKENLETIAITASHVGVPLVSEHGTISIVENDDPAATVPTIEITPGPSPQEGSTAAFTLTRSGATTTALTVNVEVTATRSAVLSGAPPTTVQFESGRGSAVLGVVTGNDAVVGPPGEITARVLLATDASYAVSSLRSTATLRVDDNDLPAWAVVLDTDPTPGFGNLTYEEAELWKPLSTIKPRWPGLVPNYGKAFMADGYLCLIRAWDGNSNPFWTLDENNNPIPMKHKQEGIDVWNISDPRSPRRVQSWDDDRLREAHGLGLWNRDGQIVLVAQTHKGIAFYDVTSIGTRLELLAELDLPGVSGGDYRGAWWLAVQAPYVYVAAIGNGLHVVEARDPTAPRQVNHLPTGQLGGVSPASVSAVGNLLVLAETEMGRRYATLDISDPVNPVLIETIDGAAGYSHLFTAGQLFASGSVRDSPRCTCTTWGTTDACVTLAKPARGWSKAAMGPTRTGTSSVGSASRWRSSALTRRRWSAAALPDLKYLARTSPIWSAT